MFTMLNASADAIMTLLMSFWAGFFFGAVIMFFVVRGQYLQMKKVVEFKNRLDNAQAEVSEVGPSGVWSYPVKGKFQEARQPYGFGE